MAAPTDLVFPEQQVAQAPPNDLVFPEQQQAQAPPTDLQFPSTGEDGTLLGRVATAPISMGSSQIVGAPYSAVKLMGLVKDLTVTGTNMLLNKFRQQPVDDVKQDQEANVVGDLATVGLGSDTAQKFADEHLISPEEATGKTFDYLNAGAKGLARTFGAEEPQDVHPAEFQSGLGKVLGAGLGGASVGLVTGGPPGAIVGGIAGAAGQLAANAAEDSKYSPLAGVVTGIAVGLLAHHYMGQPGTPQQKMSAEEAAKANPIPQGTPTPYQAPDPKQVEAALTELNDLKNTLPQDTSGPANKGRAKTYAGAVGETSTNEEIFADLHANAVKNSENGDPAYAYNNGVVPQERSAAVGLHILQKYGVDVVQGMLERDGGGPVGPEMMSAANMTRDYLVGQNIQWAKLAAIPGEEGEQFRQASSVADQRLTEYMKSFTPYLSDTGRALGISDMRFTDADYALINQKLGQANMGNVDAMTQAIKEMMQQKAVAMGLSQETTKTGGWFAKLNEVRRAFLLSSIKSMVRVTTSMGLMTLGKEGEGFIEAGVGKVRNAIAGGEQGRSFGGMAARYQDFGSNLIDSLSTYVNAWKNEDYVPMITDANGKEIPMTNVAQYGKEIQGMVGKAIRFTGRGIAASDKAFDQLTIGMSLREQAHNLAKDLISRNILKAEDEAQYVQNIVNNPTQDMLGKAQQEGLIINLKEDTPNFITDMVYGKGVINKTLQLIFPFPRIIYNAFKQGAIRVPGFGILMPSELAALKAGGRGIDGVVARQLSGAAGAALLWSLYEKGGITGASQGSYQNQYDLSANGVAWQPNSFWTGDKWVSWENIEPFNTFTPLILGGYDVWKAAQAQGKPIDMIQAVGQHAGVADAFDGLWKNAISHHLYMQQMMDVINAFDMKTSAQGFNYFASNMVQSTIVPRIINDLRIAADPKRRIVDYGTKLRDLPQAISEAVQNQLPGQSSNLPVKPDLIGRPLTYNPPLGEQTIGNLPAHMLVPFHYNDQPSDPVMTEINKYGMLMDKDNGTSIISPPGRNLKGYRMDSEQLSEVDTLYGQKLHELMSQQIDSGAWAQRTDTQKIAVLKAYHTIATDYAIGQEGRKDPDIRKLLPTKGFRTSTRVQPAKPDPNTLGFAHPDRLSVNRSK